MRYVLVKNGIVDSVIETSNPRFVFFYRHIFKTFSLWIRVDLLEVQPEVGWRYDKDNGFSAP